MSSARMPVGTIFQFATDRTKAQVLPFQLKKWFKIAILLALSGAMAGGSCSFNYNSPRNTEREKPKAETAQAQIQTQTVQAGTGAQGSSVAAAAAAPEKKQNPFQKVREIAWLFALLVFLMVGLVLVFSWYVAPLTLGVFDFLIHGDLGLRGMLARYRKEGNDIFVFSWIFLAVNLIVLGVLIAAAVVMKTAWVIGVAIFAGVLVLGILMLAILAWPFVTGFMYLQKISVMQAFRKMITAKLSLGQFLLLGLLNMGTGIVIGVLGMIVILGVVLAVALVFGLPVLAGIFLLKALPALKIMAVILGLIWAVLALAAVIILSMALYAPLRLWSVYFNYAFLHRIQPELNFFDVPAVETAPGI